jgi:hypothetical protein
MDGRPIVGMFRSTEGSKGSLGSEVEEKEVKYI